jgi:hypothetical protein
MAFPSGSPQSLRRLYNYLSKRAVGNAAQKVTIALAAGAANVMGVTIQVVNEDGTAVAGVQKLNLWASDLATALGLTASAFSGNLVATAGVILNEPTAKKQWNVLTNANGLFTGNLTDAAKPQALYIASENPARAGITVSAISAGKFG